MRSKKGISLLFSAIILAVFIQFAPYAFRWFVLDGEEAIPPHAFNPDAADLSAEWERWSEQYAASDFDAGDFVLAPSTDSPEPITQAPEPQPNVRYFPEALQARPTEPEPIPYTRDMLKPGPVTGPVAVVGSAQEEDVPETATTETPSPTPGRIEPPGDAAPISADVAESSTLSVIEQECPHATLEERRIWSEELKGLPLPAIREILRLRQMMGSDLGILTDSPAIKPAPLTPSPLASLPLSPLPLARAISPHDGPPLPPVPFEGQAEAQQTIVAEDDLASRLAATLSTLRQARDIYLNNLANASTPGFKRSRPLLAEAPYVQWDLATADPAEPPVHINIGLGVRLAGTALDLRAGELRHTGHGDDLAIDGLGYFHVRTGAGRDLYTRGGSFHRTAAGALGLTRGTESYTLVPQITLPDEVHQMRVDRQGKIFVRVHLASALVEVGQITLSRFPHPEFLAPVGNQFFAATSQSGEATENTPGNEGLGTIRQGMQEQANVDLQRELDEIARLERQLRTLAELSAMHAAIDRRSSSSHGDH